MPDRTTDMILFFLMPDKQLYEILAHSYLDEISFNNTSVKSWTLSDNIVCHHL